MPTFLITGCSSGFGLASTCLFADRGWHVVATIRSPREDVLPPSESIRLVALYMTEPASIAHAVEAAGPIDALLKDAGLGLLSAVEDTLIAVARDVFETNTLGTIAMTHAVLPQMASGAGGGAHTPPAPMRWHGHGRFERERLAGDLPAGLLMPRTRRRWYAWRR